jgi:hypothetical protein
MKRLISLLVLSFLSAIGGNNVLWSEAEAPGECEQINATQVVIADRSGFTSAVTGELCLDDAAHDGH